MAEAQQKRQPKSNYLGANGFMPPPFATTPHGDALGKRKFADFVLENKGSYFPNLAGMREKNATVETASTLRQRINTKRQEHTKALKQLCDYQAEQFHTNMLDLYICEDTEYWSDIEDVEVQMKSFHAAIQEIYKQGRKPHSFGFGDALERMRYAHLQSIQPLQKRLPQIQTAEEQARRKHDAQFPLNIAAYRAIRDRDMQVRVAKYLISDDGVKQKMATEYGWVWRQVQPLTEVYKNTPEFAQEVQQKARVDVTDPRRKPSYTSSNPSATPQFQL